MKKPMIRWLGVGVLCGMLSVAQATIQEDLDAGLSPLEAVENALEEGIPAEEIAIQLLDAGYDPTSTAELVINAAPSNAALICKRIVQSAKTGEKQVGDIAAACVRSAPDAAVEIADSVIEVAPEASTEVVESVTQVVPEAADELIRVVEVAEAPATTPNMIVASVQENTPTIEGAVQGNSNIAGLIETGEITLDGQIIFIVSDPTTGDSTGLTVVQDEADDDILIVVDTSGEETGETVEVDNNLPDVASPN
ncbi:hypothetical protein PN36_14150 [Candidatus Thiomargarita nelsonii]|uniref:Secreted protein n=1 Tax=Candidatus Thiomargarita nelsonii TaxID=1003181 RepID=A0A0A6P826_9GAMM|nr:hypothetical protein PN36_14150 [Candidatus Thiomargarita nelsonii]